MTNAKKTDLLYEGKAKKVWATDKSEYVIVDYKDDATAFNGVKKGTILGKGVVNNTMSDLMFAMLEKKGIKTHFVEKLSDRETLCRKVTIIPVEVIVRNVTAGSMAKRLKIDEGIILPRPIQELCWKDDEKGDPLLNDDHALAFELATQDELTEIHEITGRVNSLMREFFDTLGITLVDFKLEYGKDSQGRLLLADEISPDTCRFWDKETGKKLDKDRFRRDLGDVEDAYAEMLSRVSSAGA
ncbi:MAG: phosphoribosylaminoimidazolesuccinocarboxamide synthase [Spirochaetaceae bacterium]|nr:phosphoribosylaminoimidazolesuccinocarboxamide synthase [Spirochaetaceae bacterium]